MPTNLRPIRWVNGSLYLLEQRLLPFEEKWVKCQTVEQVASAIEDMTVRGAPAIGITAAYGVAVAGVRSRTSSSILFKEEIVKAISRLRKTRPTAVNLFWALDRMQKKLERLKDSPVVLQKKELEKEAVAIHREDEALCTRLGEVWSGFIVWVQKCFDPLQYRGFGDRRRWDGSGGNHHGGPKEPKTSCVGG